MLIIIFLSSGLFLGWSLGANDSANIFGTAVGSKMVKFKTAALISSIFVILGAGFAGAGTSQTLGELGSINQIAGAFIAALSAALTVYWMTKFKLPVSTSQAIVGAILGWNFFSGALTDYESLTKILVSWLTSPILAGIFTIIFYIIGRLISKYIKIHLLHKDHYIRIGLIIVGAFGAYSLGANNVANVMGIFVPVTPFRPLAFKSITITGAEQLFILGGIAIAAGIITYSKKVMATVGSELFSLKPATALIVVLSMSVVMFLFSSTELETFLIKKGLPSIPLVPISSSQAIIGAIVGLGIIHGGRGLNYKVLGHIALGWLTTPILAGILSFFSLFFMQNVFNQQVYRPVSYTLSPHVLLKLKKEKAFVQQLEKISHTTFKTASMFKEALEQLHIPSGKIEDIINYAQVDHIKVDIDLIKIEIKNSWIIPEQVEALKTCQGKSYSHRWAFFDDLAKHDSWKLKPDTKINKRHNRNLKIKLRFLYRKLIVVQ